VEDCKLSNREVMEVGNCTVPWVFPTQTPCVVYSRHLLTLNIMAGIATHRGCCRPKPPFRVDMLLMRRAWSGSELRLVSFVRKFFVRVVTSSARSLLHRCQLFGSSLLLRTSAA